MNGMEPTAITQFRNPENHLNGSNLQLWVNMLVPQEIHGAVTKNPTEI